MKVNDYIKVINRHAEKNRDYQTIRGPVLEAVLDLAIIDHDNGDLSDRDYWDVVSAAAKAVYPEGK